MHVCFICSHYPPYPTGGVGAVVSDLAKGLIEHGHAVTVAGVCPANWGLERDRSETIEGVRVIRLTAAPAWMRWRPGMLWDRLRLQRCLNQAHRQRPFDLVEAGDGGGWLIWGGGRRYPVNIRAHGSITMFDCLLGNPVDPFVRWLERRALQRADYITAVSKFAREQTIETFDLEPRPWPILYNAVDARMFCPDASVPNEEGLILFVNGIEPRKGVEELIAAMPHVIQSYPNARLVLVGGDSGPRRDGKPYRDWLEERLDPRLHPRIEFAGRVARSDALVNYLRRAAVCCFPSHAETFGMAPVEAMAVGRPVIYMKDGPGPEIIDDGQTGLLCDPKQPHDIASKILTVLQNRGLAETLGSNARAAVLDRFDQPGWIQENIRLWEGYAKRNPAAIAPGGAAERK